jgi:hypothetical protein
MADELGISHVPSKDGAEITIDLGLVTLREFRSIFDKGQPQKEEDQIVAKACGLSLDEYLNLPQPTARRVIAEFMRAATQPLSVPNSPSVSTSV